MDEIDEYFDFDDEYEEEEEVSLTQAESDRLKEAEIERLATITEHINPAIVWLKE